MASKWVKQIFKSKIAKRGGLARRKLSSIDKYASRADVQEEVEFRGYHIVENGDQWVIFCKQGAVRIVR